MALWENAGALLGTWYYRDSGVLSVKYVVRRDRMGQLFFEERHSTGREVRAMLQAGGEWLCGELEFLDNGEHHGSIRLMLQVPDGAPVLVSNFKEPGASSWGCDVIAQQGKSPQALQPHSHVMTLAEPLSPALEACWLQGLSARCAFLEEQLQRGRAKGDEAPPRPSPAAPLGPAAPGGASPGAAWALAVPAPVPARAPGQLPPQMAQARSVHELREMLTEERRRLEWLERELMKDLPAVKFCSRCGRGCACKREFRRNEGRWRSATIWDESDRAPVRELGLVGAPGRNWPGAVGWPGAGRRGEEFQYKKEKPPAQKAFDCVVTQDDYSSGIHGRVLEAAAAAVGYNPKVFNFKELVAADKNGIKLPPDVEITDDIFPLTFQHRPTEASDDGSTSEGQALCEDCAAGELSGERASRQPPSLGASIPLRGA